MLLSDYHPFYDVEIGEQKSSNTYIRQKSPVISSSFIIKRGGRHSTNVREAMTFWCRGTSPYRFMVLTRSQRHLGVLKGDGFGGLAGWGLQGCRCWVEVVFFLGGKVGKVQISYGTVVWSYFSFGCSQFQSKNAENNRFPRVHWFAPCFWPFLRSRCSKMDDSNFRSCRWSGGMLLGLLTYIRWKMATWEGEM